MKKGATLVLLAAAVAGGLAYDSMTRRQAPFCAAPVTGLMTAQAAAPKAVPKKTAPARPAPKKPAPAKPVAKAQPKVQPKAQRKVVATYFHGNYRCVSCRRIEAWTAETVKSGFAKDIQAGRLEWRVVNVDAKGNEHYKKDYKLYTQSVVLSDVKSGKEARWKNLELVWSYLGDEPTFRNYVREEVAAFLKGA